MKSQINLENLKGRIYLGKINVVIDLNKWTGKNTLRHVSKNPQDISVHKDIVRALDYDIKKRKFVQGVKDFIQRFLPKQKIIKEFLWILQEVMLRNFYQKLMD